MEKETLSREVTKLTRDLHTEGLNSKQMSINLMVFYPVISSYFSTVNIQYTGVFLTKLTAISLFYVILPLSLMNFTHTNGNYMGKNNYNEFLSIVRQNPLLFPFMVQCK